MTLRALNPDDKIIVAPKVISLGKALAAVARNTRQAMTRMVRSSGHEFETLDGLLWHSGVIERTLSRLSVAFEGLTTDVLAKEDAGPMEAGRAAGRLEEVLSEFVNGYLDAKASDNGTDNSEARNLILGVYLHHLLELCEWMEEVAETVANPIAVLQARGVDESGNVTLWVNLNMTSPPEMAKLKELADELLAQLDPSGDEVSPTDQASPKR